MTASNPADDPVLRVHAYLDGELDPVHALEVERQLAADPRLAAERDRVEALQRVIHERLPRETPSPALVRRIEAAAGLRQQAPTRPSWRALAASVALAIMLTGGASWFALRPGQADPTADMIVAGHIRALMAPQPIDVSSSDRHTVKPWFNGRTPEAPRVVDLTGEGFPLVGGRVDIVGRLPVPTLVYRHRQHLISLSAVPIDKGRNVDRNVDRSIEATLRSIAGYNLLTWSADGIAYWAVSDLNAADLDKFAKAFRAAS